MLKRGETKIVAYNDDLAFVGKIEELPHEPADPAGNNAHC